MVLSAIWALINRVFKFISLSTPLLNPAISSTVFLLHDEIILDCLVTVEIVPKLFHLGQSTFKHLYLYGSANKEKKMIISIQFH